MCNMLITTADRYGESHSKLKTHFIASSESCNYFYDHYFLRRRVSNYNPLRDSFMMTIFKTSNESVVVNGSFK